MGIERQEKNNGFIILLVLIFGGIFLLLFGGTFGFVFTQHSFQVSKIEREKAMGIAEAGVDYYRWYLSHFPDDLTNGTGGAGPYEHEYFDPEGVAVGKFSLEINGVLQCGGLGAIEVVSTGWTYKEPNVRRVVKVRYSRPSVAEYAYILNANVWAGADRVISGKYHSNGGIRMDGVNDSLVTSAQETWQCTASFGCDPVQTKPGIFGSGSGGAQGLWSFPVEQVDFDSLSLDLSQMKSVAQQFGLYFQKPTSGKGYHAIFKSNGTVDMYRVRNANAVRGYSLEEGWHWDYHVIDREDFLGNYNLPLSCALIFTEADLWVEGIVSGKISIVSANIINPNTDTDVILNGDITYAHSDGSDGVLVLGERNVLIPLYSPSQMVLQGVFVAQKGHFGRNHYDCGAYFSHCKREKLTMIGSVVSNGRVGTKWTSGGAFVSGYESRVNIYDRKLMTDPPPMTPFSDDEFRFVKWEEVQ